MVSLLAKTLKWGRKRPQEGGRKEKAADGWLAGPGRQAYRKERLSSLTEGRSRTQRLKYLLTDGKRTSVGRLSRNFKLSTGCLTAPPPQVWCV